MKDQYYIQRGENLAYPLEIRCWSKKLDENIPSWLSDICKVNSINNDGVYIVETRKYDDGSYDYLSSDHQPIVNVSSDEDWICIGDKGKYVKNMIFSLTPKQFELLYKLKK